MFARSTYSGVWLLLATLASSACAIPAEAQILRRLRTRSPEPEAVVGAPFGVGRISVRVPEARPALFGERDFTLSEANGRVFYAAFEFQPVRALLRDVLNRPQDVTVHFLFTGGEPLELELFTSGAVRMQVVPRSDPAAHERLLAGWWEQYTAAARRSAGADEYSQLVDGYLLAMLASRLRLPPAEIDRRLFTQPELDQSLGVLLGTESMRLQLQQLIMLTGNRQAGAVEPLPTRIAFPEVVAPDVKDVQVEAIALHVPEECFYVRFGNFPNYLWFNRLLTEFGGELRNLVALRGMDYGLNARQERQIALTESALAELLGPQRGGNRNSLSSTQQFRPIGRHSLATRQGAGREQGRRRGDSRDRRPQGLVPFDAGQSYSFVLCGRWRFSPGDDLSHARAAVLRSGRRQRGAG
jgi:hypothetical protein